LISETEVTNTVIGITVLLWTCQAS
jgi:hypothetical protein